MNTPDRQQRPSLEEEDQLEKALAEKGWTYLGWSGQHGDSTYSGERLIGSRPERQAASSARALLKAVDLRNAQLGLAPHAAAASLPARQGGAVPVSTGLANTLSDRAISQQESDVVRMDTIKEEE
jgi:hypothetical protein